jgi:Membrane proteins related to metalloendopeptidases
MHKGSDFGAPTGTPIQAAGDGVVEVAGWNGGYGQYVRIKHANGYATAYAHMSRIAVKPGQRVRQGQVIGNVGTTGRSTGPHLHYEVIVNGKQVNPAGIRFPSGRKLEGKELARFREHIEKIDAEIRGTPQLAMLGNAE